MDGNILTERVYLSFFVLIRGMERLQFRLLERLHAVEEVLPVLVGRGGKRETIRVQKPAQARTTGFHEKAGSEMTGCLKSTIR